MRKLIVAFILCTAFSAAAESPLAVSARLSDERTLPGLPVDLSFTVVNRSADAAQFPFYFVMEVTPAGGEPFLARWNDDPVARVMSLPAIWKQNATVAPGEVRVIRWSSWPPESIAMNTLPLTAPGVYRLRFAFSHDLMTIVDQANSPQRMRSVSDINSGALLITNSISVEVETPTGPDAAVWQKMLDASDEEARWPYGSLREFSADVWAHHRDSRYAPFATYALTGGATVERVREIQQELAKIDQRHFLIDWYELLEGTLLVAEAGTLLSAGAPLPEIMRHVDLAEERYRGITRTSKNETVVLTARAKLEEVAVTRENLPAHFESMKNSRRHSPLPERRKIAVTLTTASISSAQPTATTAPVQQVHAQLVIPDSNVLPGVPFNMSVELRNTSDKPVGVGACADMIVRPDDGEPFTITFGAEEQPPYPTLLPSDSWNSAPVRYVSLRPRQVQTLTLPVLPELSGPMYFADPRLSKPGRYTISLRLGYCWPPFTAPQKALLPRDFAGPVETNSVVVERIQPVGVDAAVWNRMQELTNGQWVSVGWLSALNAGGKGRAESAGRTVVREIVNKYPESNYYPYALLAASFGAVRADDVKRLAAAIERPASPVVEMLHEEVLALTSAACHLKGHAMAAACAKAKGVLNESKRPTTRVRAFGREDVAAPPCGADEDCID